MSAQIHPYTPLAAGVNLTEFRDRNLNKLYVLSQKLDVLQKQCEQAEFLLKLTPSNELLEREFLELTHTSHLVSCRLEKTNTIFRYFMGEERYAVAKDHLEKCLEKSRNRKKLERIGQVLARDPYEKKE